MGKTYVTKGVCSSRIHFDVEGGTLRGVTFDNGCAGNLKAIGILVEGMPVGEAIGKLKGIRCGRKSTSCADQLANALEQYQDTGPQALNPPE